MTKTLRKYNLQCHQLGCINQARFRITVKIGDNEHNLLLCWEHHYICTKEWADPEDWGIRTILSKNIFGEPCNYPIVTIWDLVDLCYKLTDPMRFIHNRKCLNKKRIEI